MNHVHHAQVDQTVQPVLARVQQVALGIAVVGIVGSVIGLVANPSQFFQSYLVAFLYCLGLSIGAIGFSMIHYLGGGRWGAAIGDVLRSGASLFWVLAILFIPIVVGVPHLYSWSNPAVIAADPLLQHKAVWFSLPVWIGRAVLYFAIWILLAYYLDKWFRDWDRTGDPACRRRLRNLSGAGMVLLVLSVSFAMFDWVMSLEPDWTSTIYGLMVLIGHGLAGWALAIFILTRLRHRWPVREFDSWRLWQDLGSLLLANLILWAYTSFDQLMLIWVGNLNDEIPWYLRRMAGGWGYLGILIIVCQFAIPFFALVLRGTRRSPVALGRVALLLVITRFLEDILLVEPDFPTAPLAAHWQDLALVAALGGIWLTLLCRQLQARLVVVRPAAIFPGHEEHPTPSLPPRPSLEAES
jgi:hypothetical protein